MTIPLMLAEGAKPDVLSMDTSWRTCRPTPAHTPARYAPVDSWNRPRSCLSVGVDGAREISCRRPILPRLMPTLRLGRFLGHYKPDYLAYRIDTYA